MHLRSVLTCCCLTLVSSVALAFVACGVPESVAVQEDDDAGDAVLEFDAGEDDTMRPSYDAGPPPDVLVPAWGNCYPPCAATEFCYARVVIGGGPKAPPGRRAPGDDSGSDADLDSATDAADAADAGHSIGCHALPPACTNNPTCACVLEAIGDVCYAAIECAVDAGSPIVLCVEVAKE